MSTLQRPRSDPPTGQLILLSSVATACVSGSAQLSGEHVPLIIKEMKCLRENGMAGCEYICTSGKMTFSASLIDVCGQYHYLDSQRTLYRENPAYYLCDNDLL